MAIIGNFEVTISSPKYSTLPNGHIRTDWVPIPEFDPPGSKRSNLDSTDCHKYIGISSPEGLTPEELPEAENGPGPAFAIDFKTHCGFNFVDTDEAEYIVFRTYLDDNKIGSAFVKRERWERPGTYRVRKTGRRFWVCEMQSWVHRNWTFDRGLHGTIKIELWRQCNRQPAPGSWNFPYLDGDGIDNADYIDLNSPILNTKPTRIRHTAKVDGWPLATFVFEYRSEATLSTLGMTKKPATLAETIDLTGEDDKVEDRMAIAKIDEKMSTSVISDTSGDDIMTADEVMKHEDEIIGQTPEPAFWKQDPFDVDFNTSFSPYAVSPMLTNSHQVQFPGYFQQTEGHINLPLMLPNENCGVTEAPPVATNNIRIIDLTMHD